MGFRKVMSDAERFWAKVDRNGPVPDSRPDLGPCWLWLGSGIRGYGQFSIGSRSDGSRRVVKAHRYAYELEAVIPDGLTIDHLCRTRPCVRRSHMEPVTSLINVLRGDTVAARNAAKATCPRGHPYDARGRHDRRCRTCLRDATRRWRERRREHATLS